MQRKCKGNGSFYKWGLIKYCVSCGHKENGWSICDNDCGSFGCNGCNKEFYASLDSETKQITIRNGKKC